VLVYLEHAIQDARLNKDGRRRVVSRRMQYVEIPVGEVEPQRHKGHEGRNAGYAPYLDYRPLEEGERTLVEPFLNALGVGNDIESKATSYAIANLVSGHLEEIRQRKDELIEKTLTAVKDRLTKEINYWDHRAAQLRLQEEAGKGNGRFNSGKARARADELQARLQKRLSELEQERRLSPLPPVVVGAALVVPGGLLARLLGKRESAASLFARETKRVEWMAMEAVIAAERALGYEPRDVSAEKCGYDIESRVPGTGKLRFIEVKGRVEGAETVTVTKNEILAAFNKPDDFVLALVSVPQSQEFREGDAFRVRESGASYDQKCRVRYVRQPFQREPDFGVCSVNYNWKELWERGEEPQRHKGHKVDV
jgi:hypothetical protein